MRDARALLLTFIDRAPQAMAFLDDDLRYVQVNAAMAALNGASVEAHIGRRPTEVLDRQVAPHTEAMARRVLETGQPALEQEITVPAAPGARERHLVGSLYPVSDARGRTLGVGASVLDVTDHKRELDGDRFLAEAGKLLETPLTADERLELVVRLCVPRYADAAMLEMVEAGGESRTVAVAHRDPQLEAVMLKSRARRSTPAEAGWGLAHVIRTGRTDWRAELPDEFSEEFAAGPEELADRRRLDYRSYIVVPLTARGRVLGALSLTRGASSSPFDEQDVALAEELSRRAALAVDNARLLDEQTRIARSLQQTLLPPRLPEIPGVQLAARYQAAASGADVGGDFYDVFACLTGWMVVIGDAEGKGVKAAARTSLARHTIRALGFDAGPAETLRGLNAEMLRQEEADAIMTAAVVQVLRRADGLEVCVASAGHPLPLVVRTDGTVEEVGFPGQLLGAFADVLHDVGRTELRPGEAIVLYTDGVTEARRDGEQFGEERLHSLLAGAGTLDAQGIAERVEREVVAFCGQPSDDVAVLVLAVPGVGAEAQPPAASSRVRQ
ncbi:MAG TPA: SpoIIE family protein phosphatase [Solirubrobacteraceae bacterium]|jgi:PAS domain S-box-containing protein